MSKLNIWLQKYFGRLKKASQGESWHFSFNYGILTTVRNLLDYLAVWRGGKKLPQSLIRRSGSFEGFSAATHPFRRSSPPWPPGRACWWCADSWAAPSPSWSSPFRAQTCRATTDAVRNSGAECDRPRSTATFSPLLLLFLAGASHLRARHPKFFGGGAFCKHVCRTGRLFRKRRCLFRGSCKGAFLNKGVVNDPCAEIIKRRKIRLSGAISAGAGHR